MNLLESLKAAKPFLDDGDESKCSPICYAITDAYVDRYGMPAPLSWGECRVNSGLAEAHDFIELKLRELQTKYRKHPRTYFSRDLAKCLLGLTEYATYKQLQQARHLWLDSLIKELEK